MDLAICLEEAVELCGCTDSGKGLSQVAREGQRMHQHISRLREAVPPMDGEPG